jgi:GIY-YIG catalytic domain.
MGAGIGAMTGTVAGFKYAHDNKVNTWTGESNVKGNHSVYRGTDADGNTKYVGITERDPQVRFDEHHSSGTERAGLKYEPIESGLTKTQARIMEQNLINQYGM